MFIATSLVNAQNDKQPKCLSTGQWIHNLCYTDKIEYYSATKMNELLISVTIKL